MTAENPKPKSRPRGRRAPGKSAASQAEPYCSPARQALAWPETFYGTATPAHISVPDSCSGGPFGRGVCHPVVRGIGTGTICERHLQPGSSARIRDRERAPGRVRPVVLGRAGAVRLAGSARNNVVLGDFGAGEWHRPLCHGLVTRGLLPRSCDSSFSSVFRWMARGSPAAPSRRALGSPLLATSGKKFCESGRIAQAWVMPVTATRGRRRQHVFRWSDDRRALASASARRLPS
jgi:hypothetical protein